MVPRSARPTSWGCRPRWPCSPTSSCAKGSRRGPGTSGCTTYGAGRSSPAVVISPRLRSPTCWPATSPGSSPTCGRPRDHSLPPAPLAGRPVALASSGEALDLPVVHIAYPFPAGLGRWADPRVTGNTALTQGEHVRPILVDPCGYLVSSADGPVAGDEDIDIARHALEQPQRGEVVLDRVRGAVQVEHRNQDIRKHVAGDEDPARS